MERRSLRRIEMLNDLSVLSVWMKGPDTVQIRSVGSEYAWYAIRLYMYRGIQRLNHHLLTALLKLSTPVTLPPPAFNLVKHPKCTTSLLGNTATTLGPILLWQAPQTFSSCTRTLRFLPPFPPGTSSPSSNAACVFTTSVFLRPVTTLDSLTMEFAARMRPRK